MGKSEAVKERTTILHGGPWNGKVDQGKEVNALSFRIYSPWVFNDQQKYKEVEGLGIISQHLHENCVPISF